MSAISSPISPVATFSQVSSLIANRQKCHSETTNTEAENGIFTVHHHSQYIQKSVQFKAGFLIKKKKEYIIIKGNWGWQ